MSIVDMARDAADRLLLQDKATVTREGSPVFDPNTGTYTTPVVTVGTDLPCHAKPMVGARRGMAVLIGGEPAGINPYQLACRYDCTDSRPADIIICTSSQAPWLLNQPFRVVAVQGESFQTARRVLAEWVDTSDE